MRKPDRYRIEVVFHYPSNYVLRHTSTEITGMLELETKRCHIESILAELNVRAFRIVECSNPLQVMKEMETLPDFYFENKR